MDCWLAFEEYAKEINYPNNYLCCLLFDSDHSGVLWPEIYFWNTNLSAFSLAKISLAANPYAKYVQEIYRRVSPTMEASILEQCSDPEYIRVYLDFAERKGAPRRSFQTIIKGNF